MAAVDDRTAWAPAPKPGVDAAWRQWVAENKLRHCSAESMIQTMTANGIDALEAIAAIRDVDEDPIFVAALKMRQMRDKLASMMLNLQRVQALSPAFDRIDKRAGVSADEFFERYVVGNRPVVLTDVAQDWPAMQRWSPQDLKARFGQHEVVIQADRDGNARYEVDKVRHQRAVRLGDFVDWVLAHSPSNDAYLTANNELLRRPEFLPLLDDIGSLPAICDRSRLLQASSFWFGPAGTVTPLHHDTLMLFHTQVVGRKRWRFVSPLQTALVYNHYEVYSDVNLDQPDLARHPDIAHATVLEVVVEPGETMFLPLGWWHQVSSLDVCLSFSFSNLDLPNDYAFLQPKITNW